MRRFLSRVAAAQGATAVEPEQSSIGKRVDTHAEIMKELEGIRWVGQVHQVQAR